MKKNLPFSQTLMITLFGRNLFGELCLFRENPQTTKHGRLLLVFFRPCALSALTGESNNFPPPLIPSLRSRKNTE